MNKSMISKAAGWLAVVALLAGCVPPGAAEPTTAPMTTAPTPTTAPEPTMPPTAAPTEAPTEAPTDAPTEAPATLAPTAPAEGPAEAIMILEPGPGSRVVSPLVISGEADSTFEQNLLVRIVLADGTELAMAPTTIQTPLGERGPFSLELPFTISGEQQAFVQILSDSPRDGGVTHLASVGVTLAESGSPNIVVREAQPEQIQIMQPTPGQTLPGGLITVSGIAWASFEQALIVELQDENGAVVAMQPVIVQSDEMGQPGPFQAEIAVPAGLTGAGRIVVRDPSPAFDGDVHLASVEIRLE